jgi:hypothetical protein
VQRILVLAISVILALSLAMPVAFAQGSSSKQDTSLEELTAGWWKWALKKPAQVNPLLGDYSWKEQPRGAAKCEGNSKGGIWNLAAEFELGEDAQGGALFEATRTCKVPAGKPIFFPVFNILCSPATNDTGDLQECATSFTDQALVGSSSFATVDGQAVPIERADSGGTFTITLPKDNVIGASPGAYPAATDGLWVYLPEGLSKGEHVVEFGGEFTNPFGSGTVTVDLTYHIIVK